MKEKVGGEVREEGPCQPLQGVGFYFHWAEGLLEGLGSKGMSSDLLEPLWLWLEHRL